MSVELDGVNNILKTDTISEVTSANGVTIDGLNIKDSKIVTANSVDSDVYVDGSIDTAHIADLNVTTGKIAADAITGAKIADNAINSEHYTDGSIDTAHIAADQVTGAKIADDAIDSEHYTDGSIDTAHIADNQITLAKMAGGTDGNLITYDASGDPAYVVTGSDGQVLTSTGAGSAPAFEALPSSGKLLQVQSVNLTSGATTVSAATFGATEVTDQITPAATSSKILVMMSLSLGMSEGSGTGNFCQAAIYRSINSGDYAKVSYGNADNAFSGIGGFDAGTNVNSAKFVTFQFLDSPNTTSTVDYKLYIRLSVASGGGDNVNTGPSNLQRTVTLMEIGA
ncbi:hypothetical protein N9U06_01865 [Gammaproteobacteria bacterium]|nr:hypothetical protein [Gammaproteobacteria bacterium]